MIKWFAALLLAGWLCLPAAFGQAGIFVKKGGKAARTKAAIQRARKQQLDRLSAMSPDERERALSRLPKERREEIERRLDLYRNMTPDQRERATRQAAAMTPEQRRAVRNQVQRMAALPQDRRPAVRREVARLREMTPEDRKSHLSNEQFRTRFNNEEQKLIEDISETLPPPPVPGP